MKPDTYSTDRRTVLRGAAGAAGIASVGGLGLLAASPASGAHATGTYTFTAPDALSNDTGDLRWVRVVAESEIKWTGFEEPVEGIGVTEVVTVWDGEVLAGPAIYWGEKVADGDGLTRNSHPQSVGGSVGNYGGPWPLDGSDPNFDLGTSGSIKTGDASGADYQVLVAEGGDGSDADTEASEDSAINTVPLDADQHFEPSDGKTKNVVVRKTEFAHLYTTDENGDLDLLHAQNGYGWAPGPAVVTGTFEVVVENIKAQDDGSTGSGNASSG